MKLLAIETSCDETAVAVLETSGDLNGASIAVLGNALISQIDIHKEYGGVFPTVAKREHQKNLAPLTIEALRQAGMHKTPDENVMIYHNISDVYALLERERELKESFEKFIQTIAPPDIDAIVVTVGPGLEPALWVGINFAKALSTLWNIPIIPVNHMEGHIASALLTQVAGDRLQVTGNTESKTATYNLQPVTFPLLALLISGGHTELVLMKDWLTREIVGQTKDDAVGEAFDKTARMMGLPYPGGPEISRLAEKQKNEQLGKNKTPITFPRPMLNDTTCDFSFSGLKTAVLYYLKKIETIDNETRQRVAHEFENAVCEVLIEKTKRAIELHTPHTLVIGGGVAASTAIRRAFEELVQKEYPDMTLCVPEKGLTGDNAIMIGTAGYLNSISGAPRAESSELSARGNWRINSELLS